MIDSITKRPITVEELLRDIEILKRQAGVAKTEAVEVVYLQLLGDRKEMLKKILHGG